MEQRLSPQLFAILRYLVEEHAGLHYRPEDVVSFSERVHARMADAGFESALDYYYRLRYDDEGHAELEALVDALVIGETYFFREADALRAAVSEVIVPATQRRAKANVWCAACASGEEPLSLAMLLDEAGILDRVTVRATDVSTRALARARAGRYGARSLRALDGNPELARTARRGLALQDGAASARPELHAHIDFERHNLVTPPRVSEKGTYDLILCRNVLIYFSDETVERVVSNLAQALRPGGRLLVGASESLLRFGTQLRCEERRGTFFYLKDAS